MADAQPIPTNPRFNFQNLIGKEYANYLVVSYSGKSRFGYSLWNCLCKICGKERVIGSGSLKRYSLYPGSTACRCWKVKGQRETPEYKAWKSMKERCTNTKTPSFASYGGRGITVCSRWARSFKNFLADVGLRPSAKHTLDRFPDNNGNYEPGNVRWATRSEQARNRRSNRIITHEGKSLPLVEWAALTGIRRDTIAARLRRGWSVAKTLSL